MVQSGWEQQLIAGRAASIERADETAPQTGQRYEVRLPIKPDTAVEITPTGDARLIRAERPPDETEVVHFSVTVPDTLTIERVLLRINTDSVVVYLPSLRFLDAYQAAIAGNKRAALNILEALESPVQLPIVCGAFLPIAEILDLTASVTSVSRYASSQLHSYRYGVVRAALTGDHGLTVETMSDLETLVVGLDTIDHIGPIDVLDALGDVMATIHDTPADTDAFLDSLGADRRALEQRDDGFFFLTYLAHVLETGDIETVEGKVMARRWWLRDNYDRRIIDAQQAAFGERGPAWRTLLCAAARQDRNELAYVLANACYWTVQERQTDARVSELLLAGAIDAAREINLDAIEIRARFERRLDIAHRLRSSHNFEPALTHFRAAERLAEDIEFLPMWRARYGRGICEAHALTDDGDAAAAIASLEATMDALFEFDVDGDRLTTAVHHLTAQKHEIRGDATASAAEAYDCYETAGEHFELIGFDRSQDRCARKRAHVEREAEESGDTLAPNEPVDETQRDTPPQEEEPAADKLTPVAEPLPPEIQASEFGLYPVVQNDDTAIEVEPDNLGSPDPGVLPKDDDDEEDDPYVF